MSELQQAIRALRNENSASLPELFERFCAVLQSHPESLGAFSGRYRLQTTDTGLNWAFSLSENGFTPLDCTAPTDVTVQGVEAELLRLIRGQVQPMRSLLTGRLKVKGDLRMLQKFAQIL